MGTNRLTAPTGVYVFEQNIATGVDNSEITVGDLIIEFDSKPVASVENLHKYLNQNVIGKSIIVGVLRGGIRQNVVVTGGSPEPSKIGSSHSLIW